MIHITVNGEDRNVADGLNLRAVLVELGLDPERVAVEYNLEVVRRGAWDEVTVREGDRLEVVQIVGGGAGRTAGRQGTPC